MNRRILYIPLTLIIVLWVALIFHYSSQTLQQQTIIPEMRSWISAERLSELLPDVTIHYYHEQIIAKRQPFGFVEFFFRKSAHVFIYCMLGLIGTLVTKIMGFKKFWGVLFVLALALSVSLLDEWIQSTIPSRTGGNPLDVSLNFAAACIGLILGMLIYRWFKSERL